MDWHLESAFCGLAVGVVLGWLVRNVRVAGLEGKLEAIREQPDRRKEDKEHFLQAVKTVTQDVLDTRSKALVEANEKKIGDLVKPLKGEIKEFKEKLEQTGKEAAEKHGILGQQIKDLKELNKHIGEEARSLTLALKGESKTQGNWGEMVLERVLELSGLEEGREWEREVTETDEEGKRKRPDVIVHLPDERQVVIDSKVSITAYERYCSSEDEEQRKEAMRAHLSSIRAHVKGLSGKKYQHIENIKTLDYVLMFVPIEAAMTEALRADREIFNYAIERNIVIVSPTTLLATLRTVWTIWRREHQTRNVLEIARQGGALHDKFVAFLTNLGDMGTRLLQAQTALDDAMNKLKSGKGNLIGRAQKLRELGAKTSKEIPGHLLEEGEVPQSKPKEPVYDREG